MRDGGVCVSSIARKASLDDEWLGTNALNVGLSRTFNSLPYVSLSAVIPSTLLGVRMSANTDHKIESHRLVEK